MIIQLVARRSALPSSRLLSSRRPILHVVDLPERVVAQRRSGLRGHEAVDLRAVGVHLVAETPDDIAAAFVLDLLGLMQQLATLAGI